MANEFLQILKASPLLTLFLVAGLGYLLGEVSLLGFRLGVAGVLFAGLAAGAIWPELTIPEILGTFGLVLFVYSMGLQSGRGFFRNFRAQGARYAAFTLGVLLVGFLSLLLVASYIHLTGARAAGLFTGAVTNTPALAVVLQMAHSNLPAETYSIAYPFGVIGILLCFHLSQRLWKPVIEKPADIHEIQARNFAVKNPGIAGQTVGDIQRLYPQAGFQISRVQHGGKVEVPGNDTRLEYGDVVVAVGEVESLQRAQLVFGEVAEMHIEIDRSLIDYRRIFVSNRAVVGKRIEELDLSSRFPCSITRLRRGDSDFIPAPQTTLNFGDRIRVVAERGKLKEISQFFGDSIRGTAELDFASVGIGLVIGVLVGMIPPSPPRLRIVPARLCGRPPGGGAGARKRGANRSHQLDHPHQRQPDPAASGTAVVSGIGRRAFRAGLRHDLSEERTGAANWWRPGDALGDADRAGCRVPLSPHPVRRTAGGGFGHPHGIGRGGLRFAPDPHRPSGGRLRQRVSGGDDSESNPGASHFRVRTILKPGGEGRLSSSSQPASGVTRGAAI